MVTIVPKDLAKRIMQQMVDAEVEALANVKPIIEKVLVETVGTTYYSLSMLKAMGGPYSTHHPNPPMPPGVVNMQSGRFFKSFVVTTPQKLGDKVLMSIYCTDDERLRQMAGTEHEIPRPFKRILQDRMRRQVSRVLGKELKGIIQVKVRG